MTQKQTMWSSLSSSSSSLSPTTASSPLHHPLQLLASNINNWSMPTMDNMLEMCKSKVMKYANDAPETQDAPAAQDSFWSNLDASNFPLLEIFLQLHLLREPGYQPRSKGDQCPLRYCESCLLLGPKGSQWIPLVLLNLLPRHQAWPVPSLFFILFD